MEKNELLFGENINFFFEKRSFSIEKLLENKKKSFFIEKTVKIHEKVDKINKKLV